MNNKQTTRSKKKKKKVIKKVLLVILIIIVALVAWFIYKTQKNGGGLSGALKTVVGHDENTKKNLKEIKVLVLGVSTDIDSELTDTIIVASYNPNNQTANLLSIPRDTYTGTNPSKAVASKKINAIYNITNDPLETLNAVNEITGLDIEYYVIVRTEGLIKLVDAIGGIEFNVPIDMNYHDASQDLSIELEAGMQHIDGDKAEQLLRFRHNDDNTSYPYEYGDNDFGRMRTQREFIMETIKQTIQIKNIFKLGQIIDVLNENIETNLSISLMKDYIPYVIDFSTLNMESAVLPVNSPNLKETNNVSILVVNKAEAQELIDSMFNKPEGVETDKNNTIANDIEVDSEESEPIKIEIINGSGNTEKLEKAKTILEEAGYEIKKTGKTSTISKTVITNKKSLTNDELIKIKTLLGTGSISTNQSSTSMVDVTIIIGKDF